MQDASYQEKDISAKYMNANKNMETEQAQTQVLLRYIAQISAQLHLHQDMDAALKQLAASIKNLPGFSTCALYLRRAEYFYHVQGKPPAKKKLHNSLLAPEMVAQLMDPHYAYEEAYLIPTTLPTFQQPALQLFRDASQKEDKAGQAESQPLEMVLLIPLIGDTGTTLGILLLAGSKYDLTAEKHLIAVLALFAQQLALLINRLSLQEKIRQLTDEQALQENRHLHLSQELEEAREQAQEAEQIKNHFLMTASHELRTPLTAIQGYLELLDDFKQTLSNELKERFVNNARRACEELVLLMGNVIDARHIEQDKIKLTLQATNLKKALVSILEILEPLVKKDERQIDLAVPDDLALWVDELRLRQILLNLLSNALKYSPASTHIKVSTENKTYNDLQESFNELQQTARLSAKRQYTVITIQDWGPGIAPAAQARLFHKFKRLKDNASNHPNNDQPGTGLGLYLCRQLSEAMSGYTWVESTGRAGEGARFRVALPLA